MENWEQIKEFPQYSISDRGGVRNDLTDRIMVVSENQAGAPYVGLMKDGKQYIRSVSRLMALAFVDQDNPNHNTPMHLDGNRSNVNPDNVVYRPRWYVLKYMRQFKKRFHVTWPNPIQDVETGEVYTDSWDCCIKNGLLEEKLVLAITNHEPVWPTNQRFEPEGGW